MDEQRQPRAVTLSDVALKAGVSPGTVSRALNCDPSAVTVSQETIDRVRRIAMDMGYVPSLAGRALRTGQTGNLAIITPYTLSGHRYPYNVEILESLVRALTGKGHGALQLDALDRHAVDSLGALGVADGAIVFPCGPALDVAALRKRIPVVLAAHHDGQTPSVCIDGEAGGYVASKHLFDLGHRRVAAVHGELNRQEYLDLFRGFQRAAEEQADRLEEVVTVRADWPTEAPEAADRVLSLWPRPTGVFVGDGKRAVLIIRRFRERGVRVPEDISVSAANQPALIVPEQDPDLTCYVYPYQEIGRLLAEMILAEVAGARRGAPVVLVKGSMRPGRTARRLDPSEGGAAAHQATM